MTKFDSLLHDYKNKLIDPVTALNKLHGIYKHYIEYDIFEYILNKKIQDTLTLSPTIEPIDKDHHRHQRSFVSRPLSLSSSKTGVGFGETLLNDFKDLTRTNVLKDFTRTYKKLNIIVFNLRMDRMLGSMMYNFQLNPFEGTRYMSYFCHKHLYNKHIEYKKTNPSSLLNFEIFHYPHDADTIDLQPMKQQPTKQQSKHQSKHHSKQQHQSTRQQHQSTRQQHQSTQQQQQQQQSSQQSELRIDKAAQGFIDTILRYFHSQDTCVTFFVSHFNFQDDGIHSLATVLFKDFRTRKINLFIVESNKYDLKNKHDRQLHQYTTDLSVKLMEHMKKRYETLFGVKGNRAFGDKYILDNFSLNVCDDDSEYTQDGYCMLFAYLLLDYFYDSFSTIYDHNNTNVLEYCTVPDMTVFLRRVQEVLYEFLQKKKGNGKGLNKNKLKLFTNNYVFHILQPLYSENENTTLNYPFYN